MEKIKRNQLEEMLSNFEKERSKYLITLFDSLHKRKIELPYDEIRKLIIDLEKEIENYNKHNKLQLKLKKRTTSSTTTIEINTISDDEEIVLCSFEIFRETEIQGIPIEDLTTYLKSINGKEIELSPESRVSFLPIIEEYIMRYCSYYNDADKLGIKKYPDLLRGTVEITINKKINNDVELFSQFTIINL